MAEIIQTISTVTSLPTPPNPNNPSTFDDLAYPYTVAQNAFGVDVNDMATELNTFGSQVNDVRDEIIEAKDAVLTNYKGVWSSLTTYLVGQSVSYGGFYWISNVNSNLNNTPIEGANWSKRGVVGGDITTKQDILVSGENIKTINGKNVLGSGDLTIGGSPIVFLSNVTANNSATVDIETTFTTDYDEYLLIATGVRLDSNTTLNGRMKIGGSYIATSTYNYHTNQSKAQFDTYVGNSSLNAPKTNFIIASFAGTATTDHIDFKMSINSPSSTTLAKTVSWQGLAVFTGNDAIATASGVAFNSGVQALTGIRIYPSAGLIVSGAFALYGIKKS